ncbi:MAG: ATP-binding cassette domain-containing protein [Candidatus Rifleibacteriota bacterium]
MTVNNLRIKIEEFKYNSNEHKVLEHIDFNIEPGKIHHVYGPSGCGKSTLLAILNGDIKPENNKVCFKGNLGALNEIKRMRSTQDPQMQLATASVIDELLLSPEYRENSADKALKKALQTSKYFDLCNILTRDTSVLSFGQARLLGLACIWQYPPELLLLDEPLTGLDCTHTKIIKDALEKIIQTGTAVVLTHTSRIAGERSIELKNISQSPPPEPPDFNLFETRKALIAKEVVWKYWPGKQSISFELKPGELIILTGPNGSGKTQLLQRIAGIRKFSEGELINYDQTAYVSQCPEKEMFAESLPAEIMIGSDVQTESIKQMLSYFQINEPLETSPLLLSFGQQKRISIIGALLRQPSCLLLDEPISGLDINNQRRLAACLKQFLAKGGKAIIATHEPETFADFNTSRLHLQPQNKEKAWIIRKNFTESRLCQQEK